MEVSNSEARTLLAESEHLVGRLVKKHLLPADLLQKQKTVLNRINRDLGSDRTEGRTGTDTLRRQAEAGVARKAVAGEQPVRIGSAASAGNARKMIQILPQLGRLDSKELSELVKLKMKYLA